MAQDTLGANETVAEEYENGARLVRIGFWGKEQRVDIPDGSGGYEGKLFKNERRARAYAELHDRGHLENHEVPLSVARDGKKAIAAFLYASEGLEPSGVGELLEVKEQTATQYISDYLAERST